MKEAEKLIQRMDAIASMHSKDGGEEFDRLNGVALLKFLDGELTDTEMRRFHRASNKKIREGRKGLAALKEGMKF